MVCRKFKIYISSFSSTYSYETSLHMNEVKAESPSTYIVNTCLELQSSIHIHYKVTGLQSLEKLDAIFAQKRALQCVMKIILTEKLFGVGSSNFGFVHLDNWATQYNKLNKIGGQSAW